MDCFATNAVEHIMKREENALQKLATLKVSFNITAMNMSKEGEASNVPPKVVDLTIKVSNQAMDLGMEAFANALDNVEPPIFYFLEKDLEFHKVLAECGTNPSI